MTFLRPSANNQFFKDFCTICLRKLKMVLYLHRNKGDGQLQKFFKKQCNFHLTPIRQKLQ